MISDYSRLAEIGCVLFDHDWNEHGSLTDTETGIVVEEYFKCDRCGLYQYDKSGHLEVYDRRLARISP